MKEIRFSLRFAVPSIASFFSGNRQSSQLVMQIPVSLSKAGRTRDVSAVLCVPFLATRCAVIFTIGEKHEEQSRYLIDN